MYSKNGAWLVNNLVKNELDFHFQTLEDNIDFLEKYHAWSKTYFYERASKEKTPQDEAFYKTEVQSSLEDLKNALEALKLLHPSKERLRIIRR